MHELSRVIEILAQILQDVSCDFGFELAGYHPPPPQLKTFQHWHQPRDSNGNLFIKTESSNITITRYIIDLYYFWILSRFIIKGKLNWVDRIPPPPPQDLIVHGFMYAPGCARFAETASELTKAWSSGATEFGVWIGNCNVKVWKSTEDKLHKIWNSKYFSQISAKRAHLRIYNRHCVIVPIVPEPGGALNHDVSDAADRCDGYYCLTVHLVIFLYHNNNNNNNLFALVYNIA